MSPKALNAGTRKVILPERKSLSFPVTQKDKFYEEDKKQSEVALGR